jgi:hypothetical protein
MEVEENHGLAKIVRTSEHLVTVPYVAKTLSEGVRFLSLISSTFYHESGIM